MAEPHFTKKRLSLLVGLGNLGELKPNILRIVVSDCNSRRDIDILF